MKVQTKEAEKADVIVLGSGCAGLTAALAAAKGGLKVIVLEKTRHIGGTSAMSGAGTWIPANHHARAEGIEDSPEEALIYLRSTAPKGWQETEDALWRGFAENAPAMLEFIETHTPLHFDLTNESDRFPDCPGALARGRMLGPAPLSRWLVGRYSRMIRKSTLPQIITYHEAVETDFYHHPFLIGLRLAPKILWRLVTNSASKGTALIVGLLRGCLDAGCRIEIGARALELLTDGDEGVVGVSVEQDGRRRRFLARKGVVIATGGFEWNAELYQRHFPGPVDFKSSPRSNEGDGHLMAAAIGAQLSHMDQANIIPNIPTRYEGRLHGLPAPFWGEPNAILVDRNGRRFVDELDPNLGEILDRRDPDTGDPVHLPAWVITDSRFLRLSPMVRWYSRYDRKWLVKARDLPTLAEKIGVDREALTRTVARFNGFCDNGRDEDFARGEAGAIHLKTDKRQRKGIARIDRAPFLAMPCNRSILATKGGPRTNEHGQVLNTQGEIISGLYCAGVAMANPIGTRAVSPGTTIGPNMTWGYICGKALVRSNRGAEIDRLVLDDTVAALPCSAPNLPPDRKPVSAD